MLSFIFLLSSCEWLEDTADDDTVEKVFDNLGWVGDEKEDTENIEDDINLSTQYGSGSLPSKVDLLQNFPPIGNQGQYGTCVAWACGYNLRTFLYAKANGFTTSQLGTSNQFSPKDLFLAISNNAKGSDCNGTSFEAALDVMVSRGIAKMNTVPYDQLGDCSSSPSSSWTSDANSYKLDKYREIDVDKNTIKEYLSQGRAVVFGAKLGEQFMEANSDAVLDYQSYGYTGDHAYHAMILSGYDDNKNAFRVVNSWGTNWGDNGYIWVDQDYFVTDDFCFCAFVGSAGAEDPDADGDNVVDNVTSDTDLMAWELDDTDFYDANDPDSDDPLWRTAYYNVYNSGNNTIYANQDWNILYIWYDAYDANNYGIILYDAYTDNYGTYGSNDAIPNSSSLGFPAQGYWYNYVDVESGENVCHAVFGEDRPFSWTYKMPNDLDGYYYLVIIADGFDDIEEFDEDNNYYFYAQDNGDPLYIVNGIIQTNVKKSANTNKSRDITPYKGMPSDFQTVKTKSNVNAYSSKEILKMLKNHKRTGELQKKVAEYKNSEGVKRKK